MGMGLPLRGPWGAAGTLVGTSQPLASPGAWCLGDPRVFPSPCRASGLVALWPLSCTGDTTGHVGTLIFPSPPRSGRAQGDRGWRTGAARPERGAGHAGRYGGDDARGFLPAPPAHATAPANGASLSSRAAPAPLGALAHGGPLVIQAPPVHLDPWGHQDLRESL